MKFFAANRDTAVSLKGHTVVVPGMGMGNVGQMAVDVVLSTALAATPTPLAVRVGHLVTPDVLPAAGNDPFAVDGSVGKLAVSLEVYQLPSASVTIVQQRAPAVSGRAESFAAELCAWAAGAGAAQLVVLSGCDAAFRSDKQLEGVQHRVVFNAAADTAGVALIRAAAGVGVPPMEQPSPSELDRRLPAVCDGTGRVVPAVKSAADPDLDPAAAEDARRKFGGVAGSGYCPRLLRRATAAGLPACAVLSLVHEGDNRGDGVAMATVLEQLTGAVFGGGAAGGAAGAGVGAGAAAAVSSPPPAVEYTAPEFAWVPPSSWDAAVGAPLDSSMYA